MGYKFQNNVLVQLSGAIDSNDSSIGFQSATAPNSAPAAPGADTGVMTLVDNLFNPTKREIITYTGVSGSTITGVVRGVESTTAQAWDSTDWMFGGATAAMLSNTMQGANNLSEITSDSTARANIGAGNVGILGSGYDSSFDSTDSMTITHDTLTSANRYKRIVNILEETAGGSTTDSSMTFEQSGYSAYVRDTETPTGTITPSATTNTYTDYVLDSSGADVQKLGNSSGTHYYCGQTFRGPCRLSGFKLNFDANSGAPSGTVTYQLYLLCYAITTNVPLEQNTLLLEGTFTPTASAQNTVSFASAVDLDDQLYQLVFYPTSAQGFGDYWQVVKNSTAQKGYAHGHGLTSVSDIPDYSLPCSANTNQLRLALSNGKISSGVVVTISGGYFTANQLGRVLRGNSGYFKITGFPQVASGGTPLASSGTASYAFDGLDQDTACENTSANGYIGYDFGISKTIRMVGIGRSIASGQYLGTANLVIEVSDDNFSSSTVVATLGQQSYQTYAGHIWVDITTPTAGRYIRLRETNGAYLGMAELFFADGTQAQCYSEYSSFADTSAITSGNWSLEASAMEGTLTSLDNDAAIIYPLATTDFASIDGISTFTGMAGRSGTFRYKTHATTSVECYPSNARSRAVCSLTDDTFVAACVSNTSGDAYVVAFSLDANGDITYGTPVAFVLSGTSPSYIDIVAISSTKFVVKYDNGSVFYLKAGSVSGLAISLGGAVADTSSTTTVMCHGAKLDTDKFMSVGVVSGTSYVTVVAGTVSGTTITLGSPVTVASTAYNNYAVGTQLTTDKAIVFYSFGASTTTLRAKVITASGTTLTANAEATAAMTDAGGIHSACTNSATLATVNTGFALFAASVSGTTITFGAELLAGINEAGGAAGTHRLLVGGSNWTQTATAHGIASYSISGTTLTLQGRQGNYTSESKFPAAASKCMGSTWAVQLASSDKGTGASSRYIFTALRSRVTAQGGLATNPAVAISFDGATYRIWDGSAARNIASNATAVHGGTDGVWYYRDSASVWAAASSNTAIKALKQATAYKQNIMNVYELGRLSSANWVTFGFSEPTTTTYFAFVSNTEEQRLFNPVTLDQMTISYTSRSAWNQKSQDYTVNLGSEDQVTITKDTAGTKAIRAIVFGELP